MYCLPKKKRFCNWTLFLEQPCNPEIREKLKRPFSNSQGKGLPLQSTSIRFSLRTLQEQNIPTKSGDRRLPTDSGWFADAGGAGWPFPDAWSWLGSASEPTSTHQQVKMEERGTKLSPLFLVKPRKRQLPPSGYKRRSLFISVGEGSRPLTRGRGKGKKRDESRVEKRTRRVSRTDFRTPPSREPAVWGAPPSNLWSDAQITPKTPGTYTGPSTWREATLYCRLSPLYPSRSRSRCDSSHCDTRNTHSFACSRAGTKLQTPGWAQPGPSLHARLVSAAPLHFPIGGGSRRSSEWFTVARCSPAHYSLWGGLEPFQARSAPDWARRLSRTETQASPSAGEDSLIGRRSWSRDFTTG